jgi:hypothetical protein
MRLVLGLPGPLGLLGLRGRAAHALGSGGHQDSVLREGCAGRVDDGRVGRVHGEGLAKHAEAQEEKSRERAKCGWPEDQRPHLCNLASIGFPGRAEPALHVSHIIHREARGARPGAIDIQASRIRHRGPSAWSVRWSPRLATINRSPQAFCPRKTVVMQPSDVLSTPWPGLVEAVPGVLISSCPAHASLGVACRVCSPGAVLKSGRPDLEACRRRPLSSVGRASPW